MDLAFNKPPIPDFDTIPVMYQGASDDFLGPCADAPFVSQTDGIDFEGEFGVVVDEVAMGTSAAEAADRIRLVVQINDWSLRAIGAYEMPRGFGFLQAKPSTSFAPIAVTPDELGAAWRDGRVGLQAAYRAQRRAHWLGLRRGNGVSVPRTDRPRRPHPPTEGGNDHRLGNGLERGQGGGVELPRREARNRKARSRRSADTVPRIRRPRRDGGALRRRTPGPVRSDRPEGDWSKVSGASGHTRARETLIGD